MKNNLTKLYMQNVTTVFLRLCSSGGKKEQIKERKLKKLTFFVMDQTGFLLQLLSRPLPIQEELVDHQKMDSCIDRVNTSKNKYGLNLLEI